MITSMMNTCNSASALNVCTNGFVKCRECEITTIISCGKEGQRTMDPF